MQSITSILSEELHDKATWLSDQNVLNKLVND